MEAEGPRSCILDVLEKVLDFEALGCGEGGGAAGSFRRRVADVLGHKDVNTTKKHYAAMDDARRRQAATAVRLRESMPEHEE